MKFKTRKNKRYTLNQELNSGSKVWVTDLKKCGKFVNHEMIFYKRQK